MSYTNAINLGHAHQEWLRALDFYETELKILQGRLSEVALKNNGREVSAGVEQYQNQFIVQRNNIDELRHTVNEHVHRVFVDAKVHVGRVEENRVDEHKEIEGAVAQFEKVIKELRHEFNKFAAKWF